MCCVVILVIISSALILLGRRIKKSRKEININDNGDTAPYEEVAEQKSATYEEVRDVFTKQKSEDRDFKVNINSCYSLEPEQDPVYADIEDVIQMKRNDVYGLSIPTQNYLSPRDNSSVNSIPPVTHAELAASNLELAITPI